MESRRGAGFLVTQLPYHSPPGANSIMFMLSDYDNIVWVAPECY